MITRLACRVFFQGKSGQVGLDQLRGVDKIRLVKHLGKLAVATAEAVPDALAELFAK